MNRDSLSREQEVENFAVRSALTGLQESIGVDSPMTSGNYMGLSRSGYPSAAGTDDFSWQIPDLGGEDW